MTPGNKAENLSTLLNAGFNVPKFYVIKNSEINKLNIEKTLKKYNSWKIKNNIEFVAVRSSADVEDGTVKSYAGQFKTVLNVSDNIEFIDATEKVGNSHAHASYSKVKANIDCIVQEYIDPELSGVIFTVNPATGSSEMVINSASGVGEKVVSGESSNTYYIDRYSNITKGTQLIDDKDGQLNDNQIKELIEVVLKIEKLFGEVQDIEWAIKDNQIYILQSRPITKVNHLKVWDSSNLAESFPGIVLPLTFSVARRGYNLVYKSQAYAGGLDWYQLEANHRVFDSMVGIFNGRMYYNLLSWYKFISLFPANKTNQKFLDNQLATVGNAIYQPKSQHSFKQKAKFWSRAIRRSLFFKYELDNFYKKYDHIFEQKEKNPSSKDPYFLLELFETIECELIPYFGRTVDNDFFVMSFHGILKNLLKKWDIGIDPKKQFLGSMQNVISADQAIWLYEIAADIKKDSMAYQLLKNKKYIEFDKHIKDFPLSFKIQKYRDTFGHRFAEDQKIESKNPQTTKEGFYNFLQLFCELDTEEVANRLKNSKIRDLKSEDEIAAKLKLSQKIIYRIILKKLKKHLRIREHNRLLRGKVYAEMRELFPKIGASLAYRKLLKQPNDIYYLEIEEIYQTLNGALVYNDLQSRIEARKKAYKTYQKIEMPERFISADIPYLSKLTKSKTKFDKVIKKIPGSISSPGTVQGEAIILFSPDIPKKPFDILVVKNTDPGWTPLIALAKGVIVENGGMLSHAAIVTRELGIPSIIGVKDATKIIKQGATVRINTEASTVEIN